VPLVPGYDGAAQDEAALSEAARELGFPVLLKAVAGGGGRGMRVVENPAGFAAALEGARREAAAAFGDDRMLLERYLSRPRHIEAQIFGDQHGGMVHLFERDCSVQRRHQKVIEEAPAPGLTSDQRRMLGDHAVRAGQAIGYVNAGTIEFLMAEGDFYFIEMNTRLQVEHPVTEMITGLDLVIEQIRIASGAPLGFDQKDVRFEGHAIECRINAEHPVTFMPSPGKITTYHPPGGLGVRVDSGVYVGYEVPAHYDSLIGKLIVHARNRNECLMRLKRALSEFVIDGIDTTIPLFSQLIAEPDVVNGSYDIHWLEKYLEKQ
jgi:acetyl-CoA carboxylase biotin carboxylase subunit